MDDILDFGGLEIRKKTVIGPDKKTYSLEEATGKVATDHRNAIMASSVFGPDGRVTGVKNLASVEAAFVAGCLWDEKRRNPPVQAILGWPSQVVKKLYEAAQELSGMNEESPIYEAMEKALAREDSPIEFEDFCDWVATIEKDDAGKEFRPITRIFAKKREESKNS